MNFNQRNDFDRHEQKFCRNQRLCCNFPEEIYWEDECDCDCYYGDFHEEARLEKLNKNKYDQCDWNKKPQRKHCYCGIFKIFHC